MSPHVPVLLNEVLQCFAGAKGVIIDATLGYGGHSGALLKHTEANIIGIDRDEAAVSFCQKHLDSKRATIIHGNFGANLESAINLAKKRGEKIAGVLADIGVSSLQLDDKNRGFSFTSPTLDMRMDARLGMDAKTLVNTATLMELEKIFRDFGEMREHKKMARLVVEARKIAPIDSGEKLAQICEKNFKKVGAIHPATLCFQAIRIAVNDELGELSALLDSIKKRARDLSGAKVAIISFHSLEDGAVKSAFRAWAKDCVCDINAMKCACGGNNALGQILTKKPIVASQQEVAQNPRARSAKLRIFKMKG